MSERGAGEGPPTKQRIRFVLAVRAAEHRAFGAAFARLSRLDVSEDDATGDDLSRMRGKEEDPPSCLASSAREVRAFSCRVIHAGKLIPNVLPGRSAGFVAGRSPQTAALSTPQKKTAPEVSRRRFGVSQRGSQEKSSFTSTRRNVSRKWHGCKRSKCCNRQSVRKCPVPSR